MGSCLKLSVIHKSLHSFYTLFGTCKCLHVFNKFCLYMEVKKSNFNNMKYVTHSARVNSTSEATL